MRTVNRYLQKRGKTYYFVHRVPDDVRSLHATGSIRESLGTADVRTARQMRDNRLKGLEADWNAYRALPKGQHMDRQLLAEALRLRSIGQQDDDKPGFLRMVEDRATDIYNDDIQEEDHGRLASPKAGEFFGIASGKKTPVRIATDAFLASANLKPSTKMLYKVQLGQLAETFASLQDLKRDSVRTFLQAYAKTRTTKTVLGMITAARSLLSFHGFDPKVLEGHWFDGGKAQVLKGVWTDSEALRLANANDAPQWLRDCITVGLYSGLRRKEIGGLVYDADKDQLVVEANKAKTTNSVRRIPCHSKARDAAKRLASLEPAIRLNAITNGIHALAGRLGIPQTVTIDGVVFKRDFHALRHTFASKLGSYGVEESTIKRILGHAPSNVTGRYSGKIDPELNRELIERVTYDG